MSREPKRIDKNNVYKILNKVNKKMMKEKIKKQYNPYQLFKRTHMEDILERTDEDER